MIADNENRIDDATIEKWRDVVDTYVADCISGVKTVGKRVKDACQRHLDDLEQVSDPDYPFRFDEQKAVQAIVFFSFLKHTDGEYAGKPFVLYPFQAFVVWCLFGWVQKADGYRRFRHAFISFGRGNGKSPFAAALCLLVFAFDSPLEARAECYTCATKTAQASITYDQVQRYVEDSKPLSSLVEVFAHHMKIPATRATLKKLSGEGKSADGLIPHVVVRDERHEWYGKALRKLDEKIGTTLQKRRQPLLIDITTAGNEDSEMWQEDYDYLTLVVDRDTRIDNDSKFVLIYEMDDDDDELDESSWHKANPMLEHGVVKIDALRNMAAEAEWNPVKKKELRRYHCNKFTSSAKMPITSELWAGGNGDLPSLFGKPCYQGFDWGWRDDLAAAAYVFPLDWQKFQGEETTEWKRRYACIVDCWIPGGGPRVLTDEPWQSWARAGLLQVTDSEWTDTDAVYRRLAQRAKMYSIRSVAYDPNWCREYGTRCVNDFGLKTYEFAQTHAKYHEPMQEFVLALREGRIVHGGNPLLAWCALNVVVKENSTGLMMPHKGNAADKIDPFCALLMAFSEAMFNEPEKPSIYETRAPAVV